MAFCQLNFFSDMLLKQVGLNVILPDKQVNGGRGPFATYYLLHGLSDDYRWHRRTRIEWYVHDLPLIVVMPDGFRGFYTNNNEGPRYADFFTTELPTLIERRFRQNGARPAAHWRAIDGRLRRTAIRPGRATRFISANSHSGALMAGSKKWDDPEFRRILARSGRHGSRSAESCNAPTGKEVASAFNRLRQG